ncbi:DUF2628 domain-containing protein [Oryzifoliimicrobium ureilyticus]|uniref:DUF2628 domain-containing protein n=1 Tax=Oryzifoliimicrobium ureilyticus TaxID=3113724 RepID=UPI0030762935
MTSSYLVVTAPSGTDARHDKTRFIRDGFSFLAFLFPWIWLAVNRLWLAAAGAFVLQIASRVLMQQAGMWPVGAALGFATMLIVGLEGRHWLARNLVRKGWSEEAVISASSLKTAEEIYFSTYIEPVKTEIIVPDWKSGAVATQGGATSLDLFGFNGGR